MYVAVKLNAQPAGGVAWGYVNRLGHAMIENVKIEIGGSKIDEQYGDWLNIWYELTHKSGQVRGYSKMIGDVPELTSVNANATNAYQMYIPLQFWFNRNNGLALPLIALQYHDVRVTLKFRDALACVNYAGTSAPVLSNLMADSYLLIDYVYLDSEERKRFAQASHEYLIEQLQFTGSESLTAASNKYRLNFNHPSKYLIWAPHLERHMNRTKWISYAFDGNWAAARDRFAKVLACAASDNVTIIASGEHAGKIQATCALPVAVGDLVEPGKSTVTGAMAALCNKFEVKFVAQSAVTGSATGNVHIASSVANLLENAIVTRNDLTMEDISMTVDQLVAAGGVSSAILNAFALNVVDYHNYGNFVDGSDNPCVNAKLQLNGHDRFQARDGNYFNYVQPAQHFTNTPADGINVYSFALRAEDHQPTGTCNFSRIDNATLQVDCGMNNAARSDYVSKFIGNSSNSVVNIYTVNYNVLRVMSGMAGTAYSN